MNQIQHFSVNEPNVIQEIIEGEAIIADLGRGFYYSLDSLGSKVWEALVGGVSVEAIIKACCAVFTADHEVIAGGINRLVEQLQEEHLIVPRKDQGSGEEVDVDALLAATGAAFTAPVLSKYTDMEQLLLLDPIHDVDETGWPNQTGAETSN